MGVLDELRRQAQAQKEKEAAEHLQAQSAQDYYQEKLLPCLLAVYNYFKELTEHLNYVKPEISPSYPILPDGKLQPTQQGDYKVNIDSSKEPKEIMFRFVCALPQALALEVTGKDRIFAYTSDLDRYGLKYERHDFKNENFELTRAKFVLEGPLWVFAAFRSDIEQRQIRLQLRNVEHPGTVLHMFQPEQLHEAFLDKLAAFLLRQSHDFMRLEIADELKESLRQKVVEEEKRRAEELAEAERQAAEEAKREQEAQAKKFDLKHLKDLSQLKNLKELPSIKNLTTNLKDLLHKKKT